MCPALLYELCPKLKTKVAYIPFIWTEVKSCLNRYTYLSKLKIVILHKNCLQKLHFRVKCTLFKICWFICWIFNIQMPPGFNKSDFDHISWKTFTETWPYLFYWPIMYVYRISILSFCFSIQMTMKNIDQYVPSDEFSFGISFVCLYIYDITYLNQYW